MPKNPNKNIVSLGQWNKKVALQSTKKDALNRDPLDVTKDQIRQLYVILYPFIAADFVHRTDNAKYEKKILDEFNKKLNDFNNSMSNWVQTQLNTHQHIGNYGAPVSPPTAVRKIDDAPKVEAWKSQPEDGQFTDGEKHIVKANPTSAAKNINHRDTKSNNNIKTSFDIKKLIGRKNILTPFDTDDDTSVLNSNENFGETIE